MLKKYFVKLFVMMILIIFISSGCNKDSKSKIAHISTNPNSNYSKTFEDLNLGTIFDFDLRLTSAEESWVEMWVDIYSNGNMIQTDLTGLSMGEFSNKVEEGNMGFGIINENNGEMKIFSYALGSSTNPHAVHNELFLKYGVSAWSFATDNETELEYGEEIILAVYRQSDAGLRTYDYNDLDTIKKMIKENKTVLLFKFKIEKIEKID